MRNIFCLALIALALSAASPTQAPQIVFDGATTFFPEDVHGEMMDAPHSCAPIKDFPSPVKLGDFAGAPVKAFRIVRYAKTSDGKTPDPAIIAKEITDVWGAEFQSAACDVNWDEGFLWNIQATIDYENGAKGALMTNGHHVQFLDAKGVQWSLRLLTAETPAGPVATELPRMPPAQPAAQR